MALQGSAGLSSLSPGEAAQSLPGIYHRGGALLKNTWSSFREISKGSESIVFSRGGEVGGGAAEVATLRKQSPRAHLPGVNVKKGL